MSSSLRIGRGGICAAAATFCEVKCLVARRKGGLINLKADLEVLKRSMTMVPCLINYERSVDLELLGGIARIEQGLKTMYRICLSGHAKKAGGIISCHVWC